MNIGITAEHANVEQVTGVEHYTRELIRALAKIDSRNRYILYMRTPPGDWFRDLPSNFEACVMPASFAWTQLRVSWEIWRRRPDALLVTSFSMPIIHPHNSVVTIHDLAWQIFPETLSRKQRLWLIFTHYFASRFANRLIAVSAQTKGDLIRLLKVRESKIDVIHHGFGDCGPDQASALKAAQDTLSSELWSDALGTTPYILCLGTLQPRKNLVRLIDAFLRLKQRTSLPHMLVLAGRAGWMCQDVLDKAEASPDVVYLGYVKDRLGLLKAADLLVQPAIYEGFGLSLLDAFSQQVPVACSNVSSLPEVAGDAAELFDPYDTEAITSAMVNVLTAPGRHQELRARGSLRLRQFTWEACAHKTLEVLETCAA